MGRRGPGRLPPFTIPPTASPGHYRYKCEPAYSIVLAFGGTRAMAPLLNLSRESISQWCRPAMQGGTGGYVPIHLWRLIQHLAKERKIPYPLVSNKRLGNGRRERLTMSNFARMKGDRFERQVVNELVAEKFDAHRIPLSGASNHYKGDVKIMTTPRGPWLLQLKIHGKQYAGGYDGVMAFMGQISIGRVYTAHDDYICMHNDIFYSWLRGKKPKLTNMPLMHTRGDILAKHIRAHNALAFRTSGEKKWYILFPEKFYWDPKPRYRNGKFVREDA